MIDRYSAAICMRGHYSEPMLELHRDRPLAPFCNKCGAPIITQCPTCGARLFGYYEGAISVGYGPDKFCTNCGNPYPWADREAIVKHLENLLQFSDGLDHDQQLEVVEKLAVLAAADQPVKSRSAAGERIKALAPKAWATAIPVLESVVSAEVRKHLGFPA